MKAVRTDAADRLAERAPVPPASLRAAQVELLISSMPTIVAGTGFAAVMMAAFILWMTELDLLAWGLLGGVAVVNALRWLHLRRVHRVVTTSGNVEGRIVVLTALSSANGATWGTFGWFAVGTTDQMVTMASVMMLAGLTASAMAFTAHFRSMFMSFVCLVALPVVVRFALVDSDGMRWLAAMVSFYVLISFLTASVSANAVRRALRLRFENVELLGMLGEQKARADAAREDAERASHAKSLFLSSASHDLRQPLHSLRMLATTLMSRMERRAESGDADEVDRALVVRVDDSVEALERLFDAILDISKLDAGMLDVSRTDVPLALVLERVERDHGPPARAGGLSFSIARTDAVVATDPVLLERLLGNLVGNAVRYTVQGGVRVTVDAAGPGAEPGAEPGVVSDADAAAPGRTVRVSVRDTGIGIAAEDHERVFDEFVQLGNDERDRDRGIGLGLSIVRRLSGLLGATLELESAAGAGTRFTVSLPAGKAARASMVAKPVVASRPEALLGGRFVVVVDDERQVREATSMLLESWDCACVAAASAEEAVQVLTEIGRTPDALVSDYRLRDGVTGDAAIGRLRAHLGVQVPALLITGDVAPRRLLEIRASGLPVLHKPVSPAAFAAALRAGIEAATIDTARAVAGAPGTNGVDAPTG